MGGPGWRQWEEREGKALTTGGEPLWLMLQAKVNQILFFLSPFGKTWQDQV